MSCAGPAVHTVGAAFRCGIAVWVHASMLFDICVPNAGLHSELRPQQLGVANQVSCQSHESVDLLGAFASCIGFSFAQSGTQPQGGGTAR